MKTKLVAMLLLLAVLVAACTPPEATLVVETRAVKTPTTGAGDESDMTVLRFAVSTMDEVRYASLIETFQAENPDVYIKTVSIETTLGVRGPGSEWPEDAYLLLASAADVLGVAATRTAVQQGAVLDLSTFIASDPNISEDSFYPQLLESVQWNGGTWSLPAEATYTLVSYNKDLFDAAGVPYPEPGWTWDDFVNTARALTVEDGDGVAQWGLVQSSFDPVTLVQAYAGPLVDADADPPVANLNATPVINGVKWFTDLYLVHNVTPYDAQAEMTFDQGPGGMFGGGSRLINSGQAAMWLGATNFGGRLRGGQAQNVGTVPLPVSSSNDPSTPAEVGGFSISRGTNKADLAWKWISFLAQQQARQQARGGFAMDSSTVPAMPSVAAAAGFWDGLEKETAAALTFATGHAFVDTYDGTGYDAFTEAVRGVIESGTAVETAMAGAQAQAQAEIEAAAEAAPTPVSDLVVAEEEESALSAGAVIIKFGSGGFNRMGEQTLATLVEQFSQEYPDVIVDLQTPANFRGNVGLAQMAAEYDCFQASPNLSSEEDLAAILSMDPFLSSDPAIDPDDFFPSLLKQFTYQGQVWGIPGSATISVINFNKDLFDAASVAYPSPDWTLTQFLETAVALTHGQDEEKQYGYVPAFSAVNDLIILLDRLGASPYDDSVDPPQLNLNDPEVVQVVRWYAGLTTQYGVAPLPEQESGGGRMPGRSGNMDAIVQGRAAMWTGDGFLGGERGGQIGRRSELNIGIAPYPAGPDSAQGSGFQNVTGYFISAGTEAREACWNWITFLSQQPNVNNNLPARISVAESSAYRQQVGAEQAEAYLASVSVGSEASFFQRLSNEAGWLNFGLIFLSDAYDRIVKGEMTVDEALDEAQLKMDSYRNCVIANEGYYDRAVMQACQSELE